MSITFQGIAIIFTIKPKTLSRTAYIIHQGNFIISMASGLLLSIGDVNSPSKDNTFILSLNSQLQQYKYESQGTCSSKQTTQTHTKPTYIALFW